MIGAMQHMQFAGLRSTVEGPFADEKDHGRVCNISWLLLDRSSVTVRDKDRRMFFNFGAEKWGRQSSGV